jgi:hypothetical protein
MNENLQEDAFFNLALSFGFFSSSVGFGNLE